MGQQGSHPVGGALGTRQPRLRPLPPNYVALCDTVKAGDPAGGAVTTTTEEIKDTLTKILEFSHAIRCLPQGESAIHLGIVCRGH